MITASEILLRQSQAAQSTDILSNLVESILSERVPDLMHAAIGREVCARRARYLRKRGDQVRYSGRTKNGKIRYRWIPRLNFVITDKW